MAELEHTVVAHNPLWDSERSGKCIARGVLNAVGEGDRIPQCKVEGEWGYTGQKGKEENKRLGKTHIETHKTSRQDSARGETQGNCGKVCENEGQDSMGTIVHALRKCFGMN